MLYGRMLCDSSKHVKACLVTSKQQLIRLTRKRNFSRYISYSESFGIVMQKPASFTVTNPLFVGSQILSNSKILYLKFFYNSLEVALKERRLKMTPVYRDTDSAAILIEDATCPETRAALKTGIKFSLPFFLPSEGELEDRKRARLEGLRTNWGRGFDSPIPRPISPHDPYQFEERVWASFRAIAADHLDLSEGTSILNPIFSCGSTDKERDELWRDKDRNKKSLSKFAFELGLDKSLLRIYCAKPKCYLITTRDFSNPEDIQYKKRLKGLTREAISNVTENDFMKLCRGKERCDRLVVRQTVFLRKRGKMYLADYKRQATNAVCQKRFYVTKTKSICFGNMVLALFRECETIMEGILDKVEEIVEETDRRTEGFSTNAKCTEINIH